MIRIEDILGPLETDRMIILSSPQNLKIRGLASSFFQFKIPLESSHGKRALKALSFRPVTRKSEKIIVGLLWHACFGKKFKVYHWFILFHVLTRTIKKDKNSEALLTILMIMTANAATSNWMSNMKPLRSILVSRAGSEQGLEILQGILDSLPFRLPKKAPKIDDLIEFKMDRIKQSIPKAPLRIGVGYKDKGSLSEKSRIEASSSEVFVEKDKVFVNLSRQIQNKFGSFLS